MSTESAFAVALDRLGGEAAAIVVAALVIVVMLAWRIWLTVRGERSTSAPAPHAVRTPGTPRARSDDEPFEPPTIQRPTDWGFDQNKRSAIARARAAGDADLTPIDQTGTQWPPLDQQITGHGGPPDALGRGPAAPQNPYRTGGFNPYYQLGRAENRIEVEEIADTLTQAELLVQLGDPKEAMSLLARHIRETAKPGPAVWLMLLGLYQSTGREAQYNALSDGFRTLFNANVPAWATSSDIAARDLESYPQVIEKLRGTWPRADCRAFLEGLLTDNRGGSRQGFSLAAYRELLFLVEILDALSNASQDTRDRIEIDRGLGVDH